MRKFILIMALFTIPISLSADEKFIKIPKGIFEMGSNDGHNYISERPVHTVVISGDFETGVTEVTQRQWFEVMGHNPSYFKGGEEDQSKLGNNPDHPVENVSWNGVQEFIAKLNGENDGYVYRLPTEAEWEYAARGGTKTSYSFGDDEKLLPEYGWFSGNSWDQTHKVGTLKPNPFGLYDMHGNVWEWVSDWYKEYQSGIVIDPQGPLSGSARVFRGGSWRGSPQYLRSAGRDFDSPGYRYDGLGFRLLRTKKNSP